MNRLEIKRARYFVPTNLPEPHRIADPAPPVTSTTHAPQSGEQAGGDTISKSKLPSSASSTSFGSSTSPTSSKGRFPVSVPASSVSSTPDQGDIRSQKQENSHSSSTSSTSSASSTSKRIRCSYRTSDGRRCRMLLGKDHPELCAHHALMELRALERSVAKPLARDIIGALTDLRSGAGLNLALANTFILSADGRISERRAASLSYLGQLLLQTLTAIRNDWRGDPAPSAKQALTAKLIAPSAPDDAVSTS